MPGARLAVLCRPEDYSDAKWGQYPLIKLPVVPYETLPELLAAADVVAVPQLDTEGAQHQMPMKTYDAMAMAKPIVASTVSDLPTTLDGCARLVPPRDVNALASAIREFLKHPSEARAMGERARARCMEKYSMARVADTLSEVIRRAQASHADHGRPATVQSKRD